MKFKTKSVIATVIILFIAGSAFLAGFLQEYYAGSAADIRRDAENLQTILIRMENRAIYLTKRDDDKVYMSYEHNMQSHLLDTEYNLLYSTLTPNERSNYLNKISQALEDTNAYWTWMSVVVWYRYYNVSQWDFNIATKEDDGYDLIITWEMWSSYVSTYGLPVEVMTPTQYYGHFFSYDEIQSLPINSRPTDHATGKEIFIQPIHSVEFLCSYFLFEQVRNTQEEIDQMLKVFVNLEKQASSIGLGVAMTTIAVVLSAAMANRLNQKKIESEFEKIREKEERLIKKKRDLISIPVLIIATILSLLGVILPIFLNLYG